MKPRDWPVIWKMAIALGLIAAALCSAGLVVNHQLDGVRDRVNQDLGTDAAPGLEAMSELNYYVPLMRVHIYRYAFFTDADRREGIQQELNDTHDTLVRSIEKYRATATSGEDREAIDRLDVKINEYWGWVGKTVDVVEAGGTNLEIQETMAAYTDLYNRIQVLMVEMVVDNTAEIESIIDTTDGSVVNSQRMLLLAIAVCLGISLLVLFGLERVIAKPLRKTVHVLDDVAEGHLDVRLEAKSHDEVGRVADALNHALDELQAMMQLVGRNVDSVAAASEQLRSSSTQISVGANTSAEQLSIVSGASQTVSTSVQTVAASLEEMEASIAEISSGTSGATQVANEAVEVSRAAMQTMDQLDESSREIGSVVQTIADIAEQTNLLALNATIESARAGDAGKGFAVVASEVKDLARETANATERIRGQVDTIQTVTSGAVDAIQRISDVIDEINGSQNQIASAVEQQTATTQEMARSVTDGATGTSQIADDVSALAAHAQQSKVGAEASTQSADELAAMAGEVKELIGRFRF